MKRLDCAEATLAMQKERPDLNRVRGYYHDAFIGKRPHWWLVDANMNIIDPTKEQFPDPDGEYEPYDETLGEPKGKCRHCAELSYWESDFCSDICKEQYCSWLKLAAKGHGG